MAITYKWADAEQRYLIREGGPSDPSLIFAGGDSDAYAEFLAADVEAAPYVEPPEPVDSRTDAEKLEDATGLTVAEIKAVLGL